MKAAWLNEGILNMETNQRILELGISFFVSYNRLETYLAREAR